MSRYIVSRYIKDWLVTSMKAVTPETPCCSPEVPQKTSSTLLCQRYESVLVLKSQIKHRLQAIHQHYVNPPRLWVNNSEGFRRDLNRVWGKGQSISWKTHFISQHSAFWMYDSRKNPLHWSCHLVTFGWDRYLMNSYESSQVGGALLWIAARWTWGHAKDEAALKVDHSAFHVLWDLMLSWRGSIFC